MTTVADLLEPVRPAMEETERALATLMDDDSEALRKLAGHTSRYAGKRLRPALLHLFAGMVGTPTDEHAKIGALVEALHLASLCHDDVLDAADTRHGVPTINAMHRNLIPILLGDYIYARAYTVALDLSSLHAARELATSSQRVIRGEIEQSFFRNRVSFDEDTYFAIIREKTASFYETACSLGARYAGGTDEDCEAAVSFGAHLGIAFQVIDDCLDVFGEEDVVGKSLGTDLETGKITLPVIRMARSLDGERLERFVALLRGQVDGARGDALQSEYDFATVADECRAEARRFVHRSLESLERFDDGPEKRSLVGVAEFVLSRSY